MEFKFLFYIFFVTSVAAKQDTVNVEAYKQNYAKNRAIDDFIGDEGLPGETCVDGDINGICVPYHQCTTGVVNEEGETDGFGVIDIRFDKDKPCSNYMDKCCEIPKTGFKNPSTSIESSEERDTLPPPFTGRPQGTTPGPIGSIPKPEPSYCGIRNEYGIDFKIMGNNDNEAEYGEFPWMVAIIKPGRDPKFLCGGSLLTPNVVLTGAHCVKPYENIPDDIKIRAGEWDTQTTRERLPFQERDVTRIIIHEKHSEGNLFNDVALLILTPGVRKADNIGTICLPSQGMNINSRDCFVSGWGKDVFGQRGRYQSILKKIQLPTVPRDKCQNDLRNTRLGRKFALHDSFTCAGGEIGKDACTGDGGSPLVCPDPHNKTRYLQVGIVAWGIGCGHEDVPGVYADVAKFRTWIDAHMEKLEIDTLPYNN